MQIEADQSMCPACGTGGVEFFPVFHHLTCAYVGPEYDFIPAAAGYACPKCRRDIVSGDRACEIVGTSARCHRCGREMIVSPPAGAARHDAGPHEAVIHGSVHETTTRVLAAPVPRRNGALHQRSGIGGYIGRTREKIGRQLAALRARIRAIDVRALRTLMHASGSRRPPDAS